jgi:cell division protein ZapA
MEDPIQIQVLGQKFTLKGDYDIEYVNRVEKYINDKIQEVQNQTSSLSTNNLLLLVALNLTAEYLKKEDEIEEVLKLIAGTSSKLITNIDSTLEA